jgi:hypothetical protein
MDPEFVRILSRVALVGGAIIVIGAGGLFLAFRAFGPSESRSRDFRATVLVASVLLFVLISCVLLLRLSLIK